MTPSKTMEKYFEFKKKSEHKHEMNPYDQSGIDQEFVSTFGGGLHPTQTRGMMSLNSCFSQVNFLQQLANKGTIFVGRSRGCRAWGGGGLQGS